MAASWILVPCLVQLRDEFNDIAPNRDHESDGSIGDVAHEETQSDHNRDETGNVPIHDADNVQEVHAIDVDVDLRVPGLNMEQCVQFILARCRSGAEKRLRYIIYNRRIWSASSSWKQQPYTGPNPHDHHAHFSSSYNTTLEADTRPWHLEDIPVALTAADKAWIAAEIREAVNAPYALDKQSDGTPTSTVGNAVWAQGIPNGLNAGATRDLAWEVERDLGRELAEIKKILAAKP